MHLDIPTVLFLISLVCGLVGLFFLVAWLKSARSDVYLRAALGALAMAIGGGLIMMRGVIPDRLSIDLAGALTLLGYGLGWAAIRAFDRRAAPLPVVIAGTVIWLAACLDPGFHASIGSRIMLNSSIGAAYSLLLGIEFVRSPIGPSAVRPLMALVSFIHGGILIVRAVQGIFVDPASTIFEADLPFKLLISEPLLAMIAITFLGIAMVREQTEEALRVDAETDPLTGILNRRALFIQAERLIANAAKHSRPVAVLAFDLDRFKSINDAFGHQAGDQTLAAFAAVVARSIRGDDLFGRVGGEEFAAVLVGVEKETAERIAERIRIDFSQHAISADGKAIPATVSVGLAVNADPAATLEDLFSMADKALYEAKRLGRDRVSSIYAIAG